jgi:hypothetical protein
MNGLNVTNSTNRIGAASRARAESEDIHTNALAVNVRTTRTTIVGPHFRMPPSENPIPVAKRTRTTSAGRNAAKASDGDRSNPAALADTDAMANMPTVVRVARP